MMGGQMKTFKQFINWQPFAERRRRARIEALMQLVEHETYKRIPKTNNSYRQDPANTNTLTLKHAHVYAKQGGGGGELYSVNVDGSGHDGSSGVEIPSSHADFFRKQGYTIKADNILESLDPDELSKRGFHLVVLGD
jgi:hypothetical protein